MHEVAAKELGKNPVLHDLIIGMLKGKASSSPPLKVKAAEARQLIGITHFMITKFQECSSEHAILRRNCLEALQACYDEVGNWNDASAPKLADNGRRFVLLYVQLRESMTDPSRYKLTPKFHLWLHMTERETNPRSTWNYFDESEIGRAAILAEGVNVPTLSVGLMENYRLFEFKKS